MIKNLQQKAAAKREAEEAEEGVEDEDGAEAETTTNVPNNVRSSIMSVLLFFELAPKSVKR